MNDIRINIATPNGTGSSTANKLLSKILLKNNLFSSSKNLFPSNIAGLPTWYNIRLNKKGYTGFKPDTDIYLGFNKSTYSKDVLNLKDTTIIITNKDFKIEADSKFENYTALPIREITKPLCDSPSLRKLLANIVYVGYCARLLECDEKLCLDVFNDQFKNRSKQLLDLNIDAFLAGFNLKISPLPFKVEQNSFSETHYIDGNTSSALGFLDGGASVVTWYPITPSSSLVENFEKLSKNLSNNSEITVLQCEDEISSAVAVLGASWAGARAFTATSGPGLSLMQEAIGLGYFSEIPAVIVDVQRAGPSTGLPTRTAQGDLLLAHYSSHGDTLHPVLLPSNPQELYDDSFQSLNLAENLQTPVILISDLDLGMNDWATKKITRNNVVHRGSVITKTTNDFKRYSFKDKLPSRSIPRISDKSLAYFTRGSGHDEYGSYSEDPEVYNDKLSHLKTKVVSNKHLFPKDQVSLIESSISLITWGSTSQTLEELKELLNLPVSTYQVRSLPLNSDIFDFSNKHQLNFVLEQNRDGQLCKIIKSESDGQRFKSVTQSNGLPADAKHFANLIKKHMESL